MQRWAATAETRAMNAASRSLVAIDRALRRGLLLLVHFYQRRLGWILGGHCRFVPSCSCYAEEALQRGPLAQAVGLIVWRLVRCQPLCRGGFDPVPEWMGKEPYHLGELHDHAKKADGA